MASRFQAATLVDSPSYPKSIAWSEENLIAVASGHLVTILNPALPFGPRGLISIPKSEPHPIGVVKREDLASGCLLPTTLSRDPRPSVRSISWSHLGMAPNYGCLLAVCTTEGRVLDITDRLYDYLASISFEDPDTPPSEISNDHTYNPLLYNGIELMVELIKGNFNLRLVSENFKTDRGDPTLADRSATYPIKKKKDLCWLPPPPDFFKFNVDGAVNVDGLRGGIGGIMKDSYGSILITFSTAVGPGPPLFAELKAIKEGIDLFLCSQWAGKVRLVLESDCLKAVEWISNPSSAPVFLSLMVGEIGSLVTAKDIMVKWIPRSCNLEADKLAKEGIG
ncbi:hypothetical protein F3Y22_tig00110319pilonHSYRG00228 [Hibiscus syriacus]|uniref:RNase H type-1 domain-containing protein n=1 Tax=Hibiscus syriacus TaxID=106335 RepID=A0A6A3B1Y5_HIBSY|nr:hypothetical protein F3Y22_tig00110319pilonHSYRG00228 [Hibiscus syriacus]